MSLSDFVIHIDESLDEFDVDEVEQAANACAGVVSAHVSPHRPHLMLIAYDPERGRSTQILGAVRSLGLHGQLVGF
jgi:hypothetical protein